MQSTHEFNVAEPVRNFADWLSAFSERSMTDWNFFLFIAFIVIVIVIFAAIINNWRPN